MINVNATVSGGNSSLNYGIYNFASSLEMTDVTATVSGGTSYGLGNDSLFPGSYTVLIDRCSFTGSTNSIFNNQYFDVKIGNSKLAGPINNGTGTFTCVGSYNGGYAALGTDCQPL